MPQISGCLCRAVGERHDHVVISLREGRAMSGKAFLAFAVGLEDGFVRLGDVVFHPGEQRGAEVEADSGVVVDNLRMYPASPSRMREAALGA